MKFTVPELRMLTKMVSHANTEDEAYLSKLLKKAQPGIYAEIEYVGMDPRCFEAVRFCTLFCSLALEHVELFTQGAIPPFPRDLFSHTAGLVARRDGWLKRRAQTYPDRIQRHVLDSKDFDEEDSPWLRTTLSTFLIMLEKYS